MLSKLPTPHLLTCPRRAGRFAATWESWGRTDWVGVPRVHRDEAAEQPGEEWGEAGRAGRMLRAFTGMLGAAVGEPGPEEEWLLFLEDDVVFHPRLGSLVWNWAALGDEGCGMASLFNPSLRAVAGGTLLPRAVAVEPESFLGTQALLLRRGAARRALAGWDGVPGLQSQRLARLLGEEGPIWVHQPSLVQHVAGDSSWGARVTRALDFRSKLAAGRADYRVNRVSPGGSGLPELSPFVARMNSSVRGKNSLVRGGSSFRG